MEFYDLLQMFDSGRRYLIKRYICFFVSCYNFLIKQDKFEN